MAYKKQCHHKTSWRIERDQRESLEWSVGYNWDRKVKETVSCDAEDNYSETLKKHTRDDKKISNGKSQVYRAGNGCIYVFMYITSIKK